MVKVRAAQPTYEDGSVDLDAWLAALKGRDSSVDNARVQRACELSQQAEEKAITESSNQHLEELPPAFAQR